LQENIRSINYIFPDTSKDWTHQFSEELFKILLEYIGTINIKPIKEKERIAIFKNIKNILADFIIKVYQPKNSKDAVSHSISLSKEFIDINTSLNELLQAKKYNEVIDTNSSHYIFLQIRKSHTKNDNENLIKSIKDLEKHDDREIKDLLSNNELQELLEIIAWTDEEYLFASRIGKILGIDTK
jgi:hypothetical protein